MKPSVSTALSFAFRATTENNLVLLGLAVTMVAVLVLLEWVSLWILARYAASIIRCHVICCPVNGLHRLFEDSVILPETPMTTPTLNAQQQEQEKIRQERNELVQQLEAWLETRASVDRLRHGIRPAH